MEERVFTDEELQKKLIEWQRILRLEDWIIEARIVREREMGRPGLAHVYWTLGKKMATISILDPVDYPEDCMAPLDMEDSLVHELLHLHFAPISDHFSKDDPIYNTFEEQAIESIASGLISAARGKVRA